MARTTTKASTRPAIETKALAETNKSAGMRMLFDHGYTVVQVKTVFNAPYGYVYGVAQRHGVAETAANRRASKLPAKPAAKATVAKVARATKASASAAREAKAAPAARAPKARATASKAKATASAPVKRPGRPTATRRAANRRTAVKA